MCPEVSQAQTHRLTDEHTQRSNIHEEPIVDHLRHLTIHHLAAERLPHHRAVRDCVHRHASARHHLGLTDLQDTNDAHDHHCAGVCSLLLLVEQFLDRVWRFGAEV